MTEAPLIHLMGWPGVGKHAVGRCLAPLIGARYVDNHTLLNPAFAAVPFQSEGYYRINRAVVTAVYAELARDAAPLVLTNCQTETAWGRECWGRVRGLAEARGGPFVQVVLDCALEENVRRVVLPDRSGGKLRDPDVLREARATKALIVDATLPAHRFDTTDTSPADTARAIAAHLNLDLPSK
ncbi:MAG: nucleoside kinase [Pseudomonadota bacterium]